ncbi:hypothetical protein D9757_004487 [Collybiopsis confluens]|uniref:Uncharacterized protein n=1 Tax=Collybiopsis confluens TaxID=2823264 RepID=A0A8H5HWE0_9AGAR|nr:hypothetical protein D9757_004487 [Collybiopsis confluens]
MSDTDNRNTSVPPERRSFSDQISSIGAKINRALSRGRSPQRPARDFDNTSLASSTVTMVSPEGFAERSVSRGREGLRRSSGRGGLGNIVAPSSVPENEALDHSTSPARGREAVRPSGPVGVVPFASTGRGGAGNIRPPVLGQGDSDTITLVPSITSSDSQNVRSPSQTSPTRNMLSTGRGGIGNIKRNQTGESRETTASQTTAQAAHGENNNKGQAR